MRTLPSVIPILPKQKNKPIKNGQIALEHLESQIGKEMKHEFTNNNSNNLNNKSSLKDASGVITKVRAPIQTLEKCSLLSPRRV